MGFFYVFADGSGNTPCLGWFCLRFDLLLPELGLCVK
jgi:hypothetical protein